MLDKVSYILSPFFDDKDSIEIKKFVNKLKRSPEFSQMKIHIVQFNNNRIFKVCNKKAML